MAEIIYKGIGHQTVRVTLEVPYLGRWPLDQRRIDGITKDIARKADEVADTYKFVQYADEKDDE